MEKNTSENPVLCPHCGTPVICDVHTYIKFVKKNIGVHKRGVDIITELDEAAESLPIMYSDDYCICCGFYGNIAESGDAVYSQYHKLRCPECGLLDEYCLYRENKSEDYRIITRDECKEIKKIKYKKGKN